MTRDEAESGSMNRRMLLPCIKKTYQMREGGPPKYRSPASILNTWKIMNKSEYRDMMNRFVDILVWAPKEKVPVIIEVGYFNVFSWYKEHNLTTISTKVRNFNRAF